MKKIIIWTAVLISGIMGLSINAKDLPPLDLGVVVVTPTGSQMTVGDLPASVSVITKEEIETSNATSCTDILNTLPGVFINKTGDFGRADIDIRGLGERGRKVMVLMDGRPVKMGLYGCTITHSLPIDNIERIEVVRGPASVLYGSDALGGVINIITQKPVEDGIKTNIDASYGSFNTGIYKISQGVRFSNIDYYVTADKTLSDGFTDNSEYDAKNFTGRLGYYFSDDYSLSFSGKYFDGYKQEPLPAPADSWEDYKRGAAALDFSRNSKDAINYNIKVYRNFGEHEFSDGWHSTDFTNGLMTSAATEIAQGNRLTGGAEFRQQGGELVDTNETFDKYEYAFYMLDEQKITKSINLFLGGRYNIDEIVPAVFTSQVGLVYNLSKDTILRLSRSEGFRAPQINDLYLFPPSNEDLEAEKTVNYELGVNQALTEAVNVDFSVYNIQGDKMIQLENNASPPPMKLYKNTGDFEFNGAELGIEARLSNMIGARLSYSYLDPGKYTTGRPGNKLDGSIRFAADKLAVYIGGQHVSSYYSQDDSKGKIDDYFVADTKLSYNVTGNVKAFLGIGNLFNTSYKIYADLPGSSAGLYAMPERNYNFGLSFGF